MKEEKPDSPLHMISMLLSCVAWVIIVRMNISDFGTAMFSLVGGAVVIGALHAWAFSRSREE